MHGHFVCACGILLNLTWKHWVTVTARYQSVQNWQLLIIWLIESKNYYKVCLVRPGPTRPIPGYTTVIEVVASLASSIEKTSTAQDCRIWTWQQPQRFYLVHYLYEARVWLQCELWLYSDLLLNDLIKSSTSILVRKTLWTHLLFECCCLSLW